MPFRKLIVNKNVKVKLKDSNIAKSTILMHHSNLKHYPHFFSPLQMFYNYFNDTRQSIIDFFNQYLKPEGRNVMLTFNRYMILAVILNVDIKFLLMIAIIVYLGVKLIKIRPWEKNIDVDITSSQSKQTRGMKTSINSQISKSQSVSASKKLTDHSIKRNLGSLKKEYNKQHLNTQKPMEKTTIIANFDSSHLQLCIYEWINKSLSLYCRFVWFLKWKSISFIWAIALVIYLFQPQLQHDTFHIITSKQNGVLQIDSIKKASQYVNYFHLIFLWVTINVILFYLYGTKQLKTELIAQLYTKEYTYDLIKKKKLKSNRVHTKTDEDLLLKTQRNKEEEELFSARRYGTIIDKKTYKKPVDLQTLKDFSNNPNLKQHSPKGGSESPSGRKYSHELPVCSADKQSQAEKFIDNQRIHIQFVESQEERDDTEILEEQSTKLQTLPHEITEVSLEKSISSTLKPTALVGNEKAEKRPILRKKNSFLSAVCNDSSLKIKRKVSEEFETQKQKHNFKINLLKIQLKDQSK